MDNLPQLLSGPALLKDLPLVLAGRPHTYSQYKYHLQQLYYLTLDTFPLPLAKGYLGQAYSDFQHLLQQPQLRAPMILCLLKSLDIQDIPTPNRSDIYENIIHLMLQQTLSQKQFHTAFTEGQLLSLFSRLSFILLQQRQLGRFTWDFALKTLLPKLPIDLSTFRRLIDFGIITEMLEGQPLPSQELLFRYQSFQEFLASRCLKDKLFSNHTLQKDRLRQYLEYMYQDEALLFLIGSLEKDKAKVLIEYLLEIDHNLAYRAIAQYRGDTYNDFKRLIYGLFEKRDFDSLATLATIGQGTLPLLIKALEDEHSGVRWDAAEALGEVSRRLLAGKEKAL